MLKGWQQIASFLGQTVSVAQRWADSGMPLKQFSLLVSLRKYYEVVHFIIHH